MKTIIFAHPWHGSFNKAIVDTIANKCKSIDEPYQVIDLHKDGFSPAYTEQELSHYNTGATTNELILKYQEMIQNTTEIILVFPIWWGTMPAILKGFFDKVMLLNFAFNYEGGWNPLLKINKGTVITTSQSPTEKYRDNIEVGVIEMMLNGIGITNVKWYNCDNVVKSAREEKTKFLEMIAKEIG